MYHLRSQLVILDFPWSQNILIAMSNSGTRVYYFEHVEGNFCLGNFFCCDRDHIPIWSLVAIGLPETISVYMVVGCDQITIDHIDLYCCLLRSDYHRSYRYIWSLVAIRLLNGGNKEIKQSSY